MSVWSELSEMFSNKMSMVEAALADVLVDGGEGDDGGGRWSGGEDGV